MPLRNYSNIAPPVALTAAVTATATSLPVGSTSGYPAAPFLIGLERGSVREEVCLVNSMTATSLAVTRGFDGTQAQEHAAGAVVEHTVAALDYREANVHVNAAHRFRVPHTWIIAGSVAVPSGDQNVINPFFVPVPAFQTVRLVEARHRITGPTGASATVTVIRNEVDITGWVGISVTPASTTTDGPDQDLANGDRLAIKVTAVSGAPVNMTFTVWLDYQMVLA